MVKSPESGEIGEQCDSKVLQSASKLTEEDSLQTEGEGEIGRNKCPSKAGAKKLAALYSRGLSLFRKYFSLVCPF